MIEWKKYHPLLKVDSNKDYLIYAGGRSWVAQLNDRNAWVDGNEHFSHVTHYAEINLPQGSDNEHRGNKKEE